MRHRKGFLYARLMQNLQVEALLKELEEAVEILREALKNEDAAAKKGSK